MNLKNSFFILLLTLLGSLASSAQDDLMNLLDSTKAAPQKVIATFKTTRIVNGHSIETVKAKGFDFRVTHHFGDILGESGGPRTFFGTDQAADIRIAFEYGFTDKLTAGFGRNKVNEILDLYIKYRLLGQTIDNKIPISTTLFLNTGFTPQRNVNGDYDNVAHRFSYVYQAMFARKFNEVFSLQISPTFLHRNYVFNHEDENDLFSIGVGARVKLTKHFALLADYFYTFSKFRNDRMDTYFAPLGVGVEIETGGHVFHLFFTNNAGIIENSFIANTTSSWAKGEFKFGFNISRTFSFARRAK